MDADTVITIIAIILGAPIIIIVIAGAIVVVGLAILVVVSIALVRQIGLASGLTRDDFRVYDVKLVVVDQTVKTGVDSFFYFTWSIENNRRQAVSYEEELVIQEASGEKKSGATSLSVLSDPVSATRAWREPGTKNINGLVTFTLADGTSVSAAASGAVRVIP